MCVGTRRYWRRVTPLLSYYGSSAFSCEAAGCHCSAFEVEEEEWKKEEEEEEKNRLRHHHHPSCAAMGLKKGRSQLGILFAAIASIQLPLPVYHRPLWPWPAGEGSEVGMLPYVPGGMHCSIGQITACQQCESLPSPALGWLHYGRHVPVGGQRSGCSPVPTCITSMYTAHPLQSKYAHVFSPPM